MALSKKACVRNTLCGGEVQSGCRSRTAQIRQGQDATPCHACRHQSEEDHAAHAQLSVSDERKILNENNPQQQQHTQEQQPQFATAIPWETAAVAHSRQCSSTEALCSQRPSTRTPESSAHHLSNSMFISWEAVLYTGSKRTCL